MSTPNFSLFIFESWAPGNEGGYPWPAPSSNVVVGTNPPYYPQDFLAFYPKFGGTPLTLEATVTQGSNVVILPNGTGGLKVGQLVMAGSFPSGTYITAIPDPASTITLNNAAMVNDVSITVYVAPLVPAYVLTLYTNLATASLVYNRWQDQWAIGMALFIAHFCTLYLKSDGDPVNTAGQAAVSGLASGIIVSKSAGGVSAGIQPTIQGIESWAAWLQTNYGQQFVTMAAAIGSGPMFIY